MRPAGKAVASGKTDARKLQELTNTGLKAKPEEILAALENSVGVHQRVILQVNLEQIEILNKGIKTMDQEIGKRMLPLEASAQLIDTVPGFTLTRPGGFGLRGWPCLRRFSLCEALRFVYRSLSRQFRQRRKEQVAKSKARKSVVERRLHRGRLGSDPNQGLLQ